MVRPGTLAAKGSSTLWIWRASSRVGDTTTAPTCAHRMVHPLEGCQQSLLHARATAALKAWVFTKSK